MRKHFLLYTNNSTTKKHQKLLTVVHIEIHNGGNNDDIHKSLKCYQPEEEPTKGHILDKDVECLLCLVASIINSEKEIN